jgi:AcrR family transcriptional regulator
MARTVNHTARAARRDAFVDAAQRLIAAKGYEQMSIQDLLDDLNASRGAFYHYFDSKGALLEAVVERMVEVATESLKPTLADRGLSAVAKIKALITGVAQWKSERTDLMVGVMKVWFSDENAIVREKLRQATVARLNPLLVDIVRQGREEGSFTAHPADGAARVFISIWLGAHETAGELYLARQANTVTFDEVERTLTAYADAFERILGIPAGSLAMNQQTLREWFG